MSQPPYGPPPGPPAGPPPWQPQGQPQQQALPPASMPQQPALPYMQPQVPHGVVVSQQRMGASTHTIHGVLTLFTCGLWSPIWFLAWLFSRKKTTTHY